MKRVLFTAGMYYPYSDAIGSCIIKLQEALLNEGISSDVVTYSDRTGLLCSGKYGDIYGVKSSQRELSVSFKNKLDRVLKVAPYFFTWPLSRPFQLRKMKALVSQLNKEHDYDAIIGTSLPIDTLLVVTSFNNSIVYELDGLTCNPNYRRGIKKHLHHRVDYLENKVFKKSGLIIHMIQNEEWFNSNKYIRYKNKSVYADIPNLIVPNLSYDNQKRSIPLLIYAGSLISDYRSPEYLLSLLESMSKEINYNAHFYSSGDCQYLVENAQIETKGMIEVKERISSDELDKVMKQADFLLSIGNSMSGNDRSFPSKVITYMALQKPIIHIAGNENDSAIPYIEKYGLSVIINPKDDFNDNVEKLIHFITNNIGKESSFEETRQKFPMNTPEYTVHIIQDFVEKQKGKTAEVK